MNVAQSTLDTASVAPVYAMLPLFNMGPFGLRAILGDVVMDTLMFLQTYGKFWAIRNETWLTLDRTTHVSKS